MYMILIKKPNGNHWPAIRFIQTAAHAAYTWGFGE